VEFDPKATRRRFVGSPGMNAVSKGLLSGVATRFQTRARARRQRAEAGGTGGWALENAKTGQHLGIFDFLICSDKTAAAQHRADLHSSLGGFIKLANRIQSVPSLALMVATTQTNLLLPQASGNDCGNDSRAGGTMASLRLDGHPHFSWLARDDSKPDRQRTDGHECFVAHATPGFVKGLRETLNQPQKQGSLSPRSRGRGRGKGGGRVSPGAFRAAVVESLVPPFEALLSELSAPGTPPPSVVMAQGHRWGAAFPTASLLDDCSPPATAAPSSRPAGPFYLDCENGFAACGDYFSAFPGRVEGGWHSGSALASALLLELGNYE
jgi:predicted NAD/FAD-dependent oxidoreductase